MNKKIGAIIVSCIVVGALTLSVVNPFYEPPPDPPCDECEDKKYVIIEDGTRAANHQYHDKTWKCVPIDAWNCDIYVKACDKCNKNGPINYTGPEFWK